MSHEHDQGCRHDLRFCYQCDVAYCGKCYVDWARHQPTWFVPSTNPLDHTGDFPLPYTIGSSDHTNHVTDVTA